MRSKSRGSEVFDDDRDAKEWKVDDEGARLAPVESEAYDTHDVVPSVE